jgi:hypothetical protein
MRNVSDRRRRENENLILYPITFFENREVYEIVWNNTVNPRRNRWP